MAKTKMPHPGHDKHLCYLTNLGFNLSNTKNYKVLAGFVVGLLPVQKMIANL